MFAQYPQSENFLDYLRFEKRYSQHTIISYQNDLEKFFSFLIADFDTPAIQNIAPAIVRTWLARLKEEKLSSKSINRKISTLKSFFKFLMREGLIETTPMSIINASKTGKRLPMYIEEKDIKTLLEYVKFPNNWQGQTEKLVLQLFYNTGMRVSELINLKQNQLDVAYSHIKVLGKGNKERIIPLSQELVSAIRDYLNKKPEGVQTGHIFVSEKGKPLYAKQVYNFVKKNLTYVTTIQKKSPHILRHSFATHLTNKGADLNAIKELLGHSSLAATQVYTHNSIEKLKEVFKKAHPKA